MDSPVSPVSLTCTRLVTALRLRSKAVASAGKRTRAVSSGCSPATGVSTPKERCTTSVGTAPVLQFKLLAGRNRDS